MRYIPPSDESEMLPKKQVVIASATSAFLGAVGTVAGLQIAKHVTHTSSKLTRYDLLTTASVAGFTGLLTGLRTARENAENRRLSNK